MANEKFVFDFNLVKYKEVKALDVEDEKGVTELMAKVLVKWPYDADPSVENIDNMGLADFAEMQAAFTECMEAMFQPITKPE